MSGRRRSCLCLKMNGVRVHGASFWGWSVFFHFGGMGLGFMVLLSGLAGVFSLPHSPDGFAALIGA